ncbi:MAG TPA: endonuclease/exonuclease/phosphatase family protein [Rhodopila sp.]|uniref:endonuclease/exonuclease/phosphatase family protein n=1 Tax=Rhodopila sp. TaxID=2480087 RepID=UPI002CC060C2|nr:endonuclease/exonuclease/phosphatase family protein [Rhodopila sp.]HVY15566.1 endonuclease/exonuclease/phosphatase family protein [Rhodopila sp.]
MASRPCRLAFAALMLFPLVLFPLVLFPLAARAAELKVATWNLDWLTLRQAGDPDLPSDVTPRTPEDFDRLARYARKLNPDVAALEEVDGYAAVEKLFPRQDYSIHLTHDHVVQRVAIVVRRGLHYDVNPDLTGLAEHHLRSGADITLHLGDQELRILAVHLKKGCREVPVPRMRSRACRELREQLGPLTAWIAARKQEGVPFLVLGDFNRWMDRSDTFLAALDQAAPLVRATAGRSSPCWGGESFIDHILAGGPARDWMQPATLRVMVYQETGREWQDRLSDHCPVSVRLVTPG